MNNKLVKSTLIILSLVLCASCIGGAFALYSVNAEPLVVQISAVVPDTPIFRLLSDWGGWSTTSDSTKMTYSAGTYSTTGIDVTAGQGFKVYRDSDGAYLTTINSISAPYSINGDGNIVLSKTGNYDFAYTTADGISVTANSYTYTFSCPSWTTDGDTVVFAWVWIGEGTGSWRELTTISSNTYTLTLSAEYDGCLLARMTSGTTISNIEWSRQAYGNQTNNLDLTVTNVDTSSWH